MLVRASLATLVMLAACSSNSTPNTPDAAGPTVMAVTCPATPAASISADDNTLAIHAQYGLDQRWSDRQVHDAKRA